MTISPIYTPHANRPMHLGVFGSGSGTNLEAIIKAQKEKGLFSIKVIFCDRKCRCLEIGEREKIPILYLSYKKFCENRQQIRLTETGIREAYEMKVIEMLKQVDAEIDIIFLAGYMRLLKRPLLKAFQNRILNVHPADLTIFNDQGERIFVGADSVYDALMAGRNSTRSSVFIVDEHIDTGPLVILGPSVEYSEGYPVTPEKARRHQDKQKKLSDWPAAIEALSLIAQGRAALNQNGKVIIDNQEGYALCAGSSPSLTTNQ